MSRSRGNFKFVLELILLNVFFLSAFFSASTASADSVVLKKDRSVVEGVVVEDNAERVVIDVFITPTIQDRKVFARSEVLEVVRESEEEKTFKNLMKKLPTGDNLTVTDYNKMLNDFRAFIRRFPLYKNLKKIERGLEILKKERKDVIAGKRKIKGKWLTNEEYNVIAYDFEAEELSKNVFKFGKSKKYLNAFETFNDLEQRFAFAKSHSKTIDYVLNELLPDFEKRIKKYIKSQKTEVERLKELWKSLDSRTRADYEKDFNNRIARMEKLWASPAKDKWLKYDTLEIKSLEGTLKKITEEKKRLQKFDLDKIKEVSELALSVKQQIKSGNIDLAEEKLNNLQKIIESNNELKAMQYSESAKLVKKIEEEKRKLEAISQNEGSEERRIIEAGQQGLEDEEVNENEENISAIEELRRLEDKKEKDKALNINDSVEEEKQNVSKKDKNIRRTPTLKKRKRRGGGFSIKTIWYVLLILALPAVGIAYYVEKKKK